MLKQQLSILLLNYFRYFARLTLQKNPQATLIGITGSLGKSTTQQALVQILSKRGRVKSSQHANSQSGISLNILGLKPINYSFWDWFRLSLLAPYQYLTFHETYDYYVLEMGIDGPTIPNNMGYLLSIVQPHVAVVLNVSGAHAQAFDYLVKDTSPRWRAKKLISLIAKEKMSLAKSIGPRGVCVINIDDPAIVKEKRDLKARLITIGKSRSANLQILGNFQYRYQGIKYQLDHQKLDSSSLEYSFAAAVAVAASLGIPPSLSLTALRDFQPPAGRMRILSGLRQSHLLDATYNASPISMRESLYQLKKMAGHKKKIAVLGDMRELGTLTKSAHKELADWILATCDEAILFGPATLEHTYPVLQSAKFKVHHFTKMAKLVNYLRQQIKPDNYILFKSSQNQLYLERAVAAVLADRHDENLLCRRGQYWDELRAKTP